MAHMEEVVVLYISLISSVKGGKELCWNVPER